MKIVFAVANSGCAWWRCMQPARMIKKLGLADVKLFISGLTSDEELEDYLAWGDVIVQQSAMDINTVVAVKKQKEMGKTAIGDYDDLPFLCSPFNPAYKTLGLNDIKIKRDDLNREDYLWKDGIGGFSLKANYFRFRAFQDLLHSFDCVTTTTKYIKNAYSSYNDNIFILPNSIDFNLFRALPKKQGPQIRIGWTPSDSHYSEIWMVKRIMRRIVDKYKENVKFVVLGNLYELQQEFNRAEIERHDFIGKESYALKLASLGLDIGICPLDKNEFNRGKSALKWSEYSALKLPTVCSKLDPYDCVEDGKTGLVADTEDEFFEKLCQLVEDKQLRDKLSYHAYDKNYEDYNLEKNACLWIEAYEQVREKSELPLLDRVQSGKDTPTI